MRIVFAATIFLLVASAAGAAPLAGRWEGTFHGGRGDQSVTLICRPASSGRLGGLFYLGGELVGPLTNASYSADSLWFQVMDYRCLAARAGDQMSLAVSISHGRAHELSLRFSTADTAGLVQSPGEAATARHRSAVSWDQVPDSVLAAHHVAPGVPTGMAPGARAGTLLLVGGGPTQPDLNAEFVRLAGGASARIVVMPAASIESGEDSAALLRPEGWAASLGVSRVTVLHTSSRREAESETFVQPLRSATAVWLPGGEAGHILVDYLGTRTERELIALLARGGVIGGTSAGALVWGSECQTFRAPADGSPFVMGDSSALILDDPRSVCFGALRNILIAPHFTEFRMPPSMARTIGARPQLIGIGIDEATALEVHGDVGLVLGRERVTIYDGGRENGAQGRSLSAGARYDLARKSVL